VTSARVVTGGNGFHTKSLYSALLRGVSDQDHSLCPDQECILLPKPNLSVSDVLDFEISASTWFHSIFILIRCLPCYNTEKVPIKNRKIKREMKNERFVDADVRAKVKSKNAGAVKLEH
jgi:hypothetical protein